MKNLQIIHECDHTIDEIRKIRVEDKEITRGKSHYDSLGQHPISEIISIRKSIPIEDDMTETTFYIEGVDFKRFAHNRIEWLNNIEKPIEEGDVYHATFDERIVVSKKHEDEECPRCRGNGWYANISDVKSGLTKKAKGGFNLAQGVVKRILTKKTNGYGSSLHSDLLGMSSLTDGDIVNIVSDTMSDIERQHIEAQSVELVNREHAEDEDFLERIDVEDVYREEGSEGIFIDISIVSRAGDRVSLPIKL